MFMVLILKFFDVEKIAEWSNFTKYIHAGLVLNDIAILMYILLPWGICKAIQCKLHNLSTYMFIRIKVLYYQCNLSEIKLCVKIEQQQRCPMLIEYNATQRSSFFKVEKYLSVIDTGICRVAPTKCFCQILC